MKKIREIELKFELEGKGIVNFDENSQRFIWKSQPKGVHDNLKTRYNNVSYSKKNYYNSQKKIKIDGDVKNVDVLDYKVKISSNCIRHDIFKNDAIAISPTLVRHPAILNSFISSTAGLIRGYMFATKNETYKRKSPLVITDAEQINNTKSHLELFTRSGEKKEYIEEVDEKDTTLFFKETIGNIKYQGEGYIDVSNIDFISADTIFDRKAFNSDDYNVYAKFLRQHLGNDDFKIGYYNLKSSMSDIPEYGIKLSNDNAVFLIKETLKRILNINIKRNNAFAKLTSLKINLKSDIEDNNWIEIKSYEDVDDLKINIESSYELFDEKKAKEIREEIERIQKEDIEKKKKQKLDKKNKKIAT